MNAIKENQFVEGFRNIAKTIQIPDIILCISAHWHTSGTRVTVMENPRTIHDFVGFPRQLYEVQYPAKGNPELAGKIQNLLLPTVVAPDHYLPLIYILGIREKGEKIRLFNDELVGGSVSMTSLLIN